MPPPANQSLVLAGRTHFANRTFTPRSFATMPTSSSCVWLNSILSMNQLPCFSRLTALNLMSYHA
jgi:hypothetical protein|eukprot:SAG25_NODE_1208_length_3611_cov_3.817198_1_plen_65_part_00